MTKYKCMICGFVYDSEKGYDNLNIAPGTDFEDLTDFKCPKCGAGKAMFKKE